MRLVLLLAVVALGVDALYFNGSYTQAAYRETATVVQRISANLRDGTGETRPARREERGATTGELR
jgi:hypothetical protein